MGRRKGRYRSTAMSDVRRRPAWAFAVVIAAVLAVAVALIVGITGLLANPVRSVNADGTTTGTPTLGPYLQAIPVNPATVTPANQNLLKIVTVDPTANDTGYGWIYNKSNGNVFSAADYTK